MNNWFALVVGSLGDPLPPPQAVTSRKLKSNEIRWREFIENMRVIDILETTIRKKVNVAIGNSRANV
jgi:hypothetical protein